MFVKLKFTSYKLDRNLGGNIIITSYNSDT